MPLSNPIPANLRRLRLGQGLTQEELADRVDMSRGTYRKIEAGEMQPRVDALMALARELKADLGDLVRAEAHIQNVRFRKTKALKSRDQVLAYVARWLTDYNDLERLLQAEVSATALERARATAVEYKLADLSKRRRKKSTAAAAEAAAKAREALDLKPGEPIHDICGLLEDGAGVKVFPFEATTDAFYGLSVGTGDGGPAVVVNTWERITVERWIYTAAHELGHLVLHSGQYDVDDAREERREDEDEQAANWFAAHFLMPEERFWEEWNDAVGLRLMQRVHKLKRIFRVSYATVLYRVQGRHPGIWSHYYADYKRLTGKSLERKKEPQPLDPAAFQAGFEAGFPESTPGREPDRLATVDFAEDRLARLVRVALQNELISASRAAEILDISREDLEQRESSWRDLVEV